MLKNKDKTNNYLTFIVIIITIVIIGIVGFTNILLKGHQILEKDDAYSHIDEEFLNKIHRPLLSNISSEPNLWKEQIKNEIFSDFNKEGNIITTLFPDLTERQALVFYLTARVHGSIPTFYPRTCIPNDLGTILFSTQGSCADYAMRLMLLCEDFGIRTARISYWTPSIPGHILIDAYDPVDKSGYILDANNNIVLFLPNMTTPGLFGIIQDMNITEREIFIDKQFRQMPHKIYNINNGFNQFSGQNISLSDVNFPDEYSKKMWRKSFGSELGTHLKGWNPETYAHYILNLSQIAEIHPAITKWGLNNDFLTEQYFIRANYSVGAWESLVKQETMLDHNPDCEY